MCKEAVTRFHYGMNTVIKLSSPYSYAFSMAVGELSPSSVESLMMGKALPLITMDPFFPLSILEASVVQKEKMPGSS